MKIKKIIVVLLIISTISLIFMLFFENKKLVLNYKFSKKGIFIEEYNNTNQDLFLFVFNFYLYRKKYNDTIYLAGCRNGRKPKYISFVPIKEKPVFNFYRITNLNENKQLKIIQKFNEGKYSFNDFTDFIKYPFFQLVEPKKKIIIEYRNNYPLENGIYKIFFDRKDFDKVKNYLELPKEFKLLNSDEIEDNPLEFEVK
jgi:hypothetical protein